MSETPSTPSPPVSQAHFLPVLAWSTLAAIGGAAIYWIFSSLTGLEESLLGIPVGLMVGHITYRASGKRGGRWFQALGALLAYVAFDLTYAPGMAATAFDHGISLVMFGFFIVMTAVSPLIDPQNGFLGLFMVVAGMYLAWALARGPKTTLA